MSSPSHLPAEIRNEISRELLPVLTDGIDLHSHIKVAHWNIKGPQFVALHPLFDQFAADLQLQTDELAERIRTLGSLAVGTARHVAANSRLVDYPQEVTKDMEHVALLAERFGTFLDGARQARTAAAGLGDEETVDALTTTITMFEKHAWFLHASLEE